MSFPHENFPRIGLPVSLLPSPFPRPPQIWPIGWRNRCLVKWSSNNRKRIQPYEDHYLTDYKKLHKTSTLTQSIFKSQNRSLSEDHPFSRKILDILSLIGTSLVDDFPSIFRCRRKDLPVDPSPLDFFILLFSFFFYVVESFYTHLKFNMMFRNQ